jgi:hypothetical protein
LEVQFLTDGRLAYQLGEKLWVHDFSSPSDVEVPGVVLDIELSNHYPFSISPDGQVVATLVGRTLRTTNLADGKTRELSQAICDFGGRPSAWSDDGQLLFYAYCADGGIPEIAAWDRQVDGTKVLFTGIERGNFAGMAFTASGGWLLFAFFPTGTDSELRSTYQALNVYSGAATALFSQGIGLNMSPDASRFAFFRHLDRDLANRGTWVATIEY